MALPNGAVGWPVIVVFPDHTHLLFEPLSRAENEETANMCIRESSPSPSLFAYTSRSWFK